MNSCGKVIEQGGIARRVGQVQVVGRIDEAGVEIAGPDAIDEGAGEVRVVRRAASSP